MEERKVYILIECNNEKIEASVGFKIKTDKKISEIKEFYKQMAPMALYAEKLKKGAVLKHLSAYLIDGDALETVADEYKAGLIVKVSEDDTMLKENENYKEKHEEKKERLMKKMKERIDKANKGEVDFEKNLKVAKEAIGVLEEMAKLKK